MCAHLGIPHYVVDLEAEFAAAVVDDFVEAYLAGETPNPCVKCNQHIKFTPLLAARARDRRRRAGHRPLRAASSDGGALSRARRRQGSVVLPVLDAGRRARRRALSARRADQGRGARRRRRASACRTPASPSRRRSASCPTATTPASCRRRRSGAAARCRARARSSTRPAPCVGHHDGVHRFTVGQHRGLGNLTTQRQAVRHRDRSRRAPRSGSGRASAAERTRARDPRSALARAARRAAAGGRPGPPSRHADRRRDRGRRAIAPRSGSPSRPWRRPGRPP